MLKVLFPISQDVKRLQNQWNLVMLTFLRNLPSEYTPARPQMMEAVDSLSEISIPLKCLFERIT